MSIGNTAPVGVPAFSAFYVFPSDVDLPRQPVRDIPSRRKDSPLPSAVTARGGGLDEKALPEKSLDREAVASLAGWGGLRQCHLSHSCSSVGTDLSQCHLSRYENVFLTSELELGHENPSSGFLRTQNSSMSEFMRCRSFGEKDLDRSLSVRGNFYGGEVLTSNTYPQPNLNPSMGPSGCASLPLKGK
ncbi:unnamed protein product [Phytomonas sp. Hart1]|nr:unnamed protein product [Phytomonas sp. Hart1]|eukprot:CCW69622.1 unnamed protein product [Phytomonas sp. isolate Hart1]